MLSSYPEIGIELHTREDANDGIKSVKSRAYERHTEDAAIISSQKTRESLSQNLERHVFSGNLKLGGCPTKNK